MLYCISNNQKREKMRDLATVITREQAIASFMECYVPVITQEEQRYNCHPDLPLRRETWNNYTDALCKDGQISDWQYENWSQPDYCDGCNS